jgi:hypothetical protein
MAGPKAPRKDLKAARARAAGQMMKAAEALRDEPRFRPIRSQVRRATAPGSAPAEQARAKERLLSADVWRHPEVEQALAELDGIRRRLPWWKRI